MIEIGIQFSLQANKLVIRNELLLPMVYDENRWPSGVSLTRILRMIFRLSLRTSTVTDICSPCI